MKLVAHPFLRRFRLGPATRISLGLSALLVSCLLALNLLFGLVPDSETLLRQLREHISENLAVQTAALMQSDDVQTLSKTLQHALARNSQVRSIAVRRDDGQILATAGDHSRYWIAPPKGVSDTDHVRVPLLMGHQRWGDVEISYRPIGPQTVWEWLCQPTVVLVVSLGLFSFLAFSLYLRRVLDYLDPSAAIPDRVRTAFDAFTEGVMVIDTAGRIVLANAVFRSWVQHPGANLYGQRIQNVPWLQPAFPTSPSDYPWARAMAQGSQQKGEHLEFRQENGESIKTMINCAPILDARRKVRGCIVTFDNVSEVERINQHLLQTMADLAQSREQIEIQNKELRELATRDPLTGCLNRRSLYEKFDKLFVQARDTNRPLSCIMIDIDHFKSFNDRFGHAIGDFVLKAVSHCLSAGLRDVDLLGRYGGEEFCIVLWDTNLEEACRVAERLRLEIEHRAGKRVRTIQGIVVTSSFGVSVLQPSTENVAQLIDQSDKMLYAAKAGGRNCVRGALEVETAP